MLLSDLEEILKGVYLVKELSAKTLDYIQSFGEMLSNIIISYAFLENKVDNDFLDARRVIISDNNFGSAHIITDITNKNIKEYFYSQP